MRLWVARGLRLGCVLLAAAIAVTCVQSKTTPCGDGRCPENLTCVVLGTPVVENAIETCVTRAQLAACMDLPDGTACMLGVETGTCFSDACYPAVCGDHIRDAAEACDDGNREGGDECSASCTSREVCGDGAVDLLIGEQCESELVGLSGDGCSSKCTNELDVWRSILPRAPSARLLHALAPAPGFGVLLFSGNMGSGGAGTYEDTWRWDGAAWTELDPATAIPPRRGQSAIAFDPRRNRTVMFGGRTLAGAKLDDLWEWDGVTWIQRSPAGLRPTARYGASMACSAVRCVLFGGQTGNENLAGRSNETWSWDGTAWTLLAITSAMRPGVRENAAMVFDSTRDRVVLFGGLGSAVLADTWELDGVQWTRPVLQPTVLGSDKPVAAFDAANSRTVLVSGPPPYPTFHYDGTQWVDSGARFAGAYPELSYDPIRQRVVAIDTWGQAWESGANNAWSVATPTRPRSTTILSAYDPIRARTLVVDHGGGPTPPSTWEWDGLGWHRLVTPVHPPAAVDASVAFDSACGQLVMFGTGATGNDTWTLSNGVWTQHPGVLRPSGRVEQAMTYDATRGAVLVFGGRLTSSFLPTNDLWAFSGPCNAKTWSLVPTPTAPPARAGARLAYDAVREVAVLFGGSDRNFNDTWEWDGASWSMKTPATVPPPRKAHGMAYDPRRGAIVVFGGDGLPQRLSDTWSWDGTTWTDVAPIVAPVARMGITMAQDPIAGLLVVGGSLADGGVGDVMRLRSETLEPRERCRTESDDVDDDDLAGCADPDCHARCAPLCPPGLSCGGPRCGDTMCDMPREDYALCPADCPAPPL